MDLREFERIQQLEDRQQKLFDWHLQTKQLELVRALPLNRPVYLSNQTSAAAAQLAAHLPMNFEQELIRLHGAGERDLLLKFVEQAVDRAIFEASELHAQQMLDSTAQEADL